MSSRNLETRNRILIAVLKLLEAGFGPGRGVRMSDIAKEAGVSRQALYLHFATRTELLVAATQYLDELNDSDARLAASRRAKTGVERLDAFIDAWGSYIPEIYGVAKALLAMGESDEAAALAWSDRMQAMRRGCEAAINALADDDSLSSDHSPDRATDILWTLLSVHNWEQLTQQCAWTQSQYLKAQKHLAHQLFLKPRA
jgi:AcrR family transcriptional regulator